MNLKLINYEKIKYMNYHLYQGDVDTEGLTNIYIFENNYYLIFIIFNMLITTYEHFRGQFNLEIPKKCTFKSNPSLKNYKKLYKYTKNINIIFVN